MRAPSSAYSSQRRRRFFGAAPDGEHRTGYLAAHDPQFLARLHRVQPYEVRAAVAHVGDAAFERRLERAALGAEFVAARADHERRIDLVARGDGGADLADRFVERDAAPPGQRPRLLRRFLILDLHSGDARTHELADRIVHVDRVAETGVAVDEDRDRRARGDVPHVVDDVAQADDAVVRHAEQIRRHLRAGDEETLKPDLLAHACVERTESARHHAASGTGEQFPEGESLGVGIG